MVSEVSGSLSGLDKYRSILLIYILKFQQKIKEIVIQIAVWLGILSRTKTRSASVDNYNKAKTLIFYSQVHSAGHHQTINPVLY